MLYCVWDGHGGKEVAAFAKEKFKSVLVDLPDFKNGKFKEALI